MAQKLIDAVAKAIGPNPAIVLITTFGSHSTVMVASASTRRLIGTISRGHDGAHTLYMLQAPDHAVVRTHCDLGLVIESLKAQRGYVSGRNRNYSKAQYKTEAFA